MKQEKWHIERDRPQENKFWDSARIMAGEVIIAEVQVSEGPEKRGAERLAMMAAAPAMLAALESFMRQATVRNATQSTDIGLANAADAARAVIRAAKGGES